MTWFLRDTLEKNKWNISVTARELNMYRPSLYRLLSMYGITRQRKHVSIMSPELRRFLGFRNKEMRI